MMIFGKRLSEYFAVAKPFVLLILIVGIARLALSLGGAPTSAVKWLSISAVMWIGVLYYSVSVHKRGFGSYKHLLPVLFLLAVSVQVIVVPSIILAIFTGRDNIYTVPEYSFGNDGKTWLHAGAHLLFGTTAGSLVGWVVGCAIMFATKKLVTKGQDTAAASRT